MHTSNSNVEANWGRLAEFTTTEITVQGLPPSPRLEKMIKENVGPNFENSGHACSGKPTALTFLSVDSLAVDFWCCGCKIEALLERSASQQYVLQFLAVWGRHVGVGCSQARGVEGGEQRDRAPHRNVNANVAPTRRRPTLSKLSEKDTHTHPHSSLTGSITTRKEQTPLNVLALKKGLP